MLSSVTIAVIAALCPPFLIATRKTPVSHIMALCACACLCGVVLSGVVLLSHPASAGSWVSSEIVGTLATTCTLFSVTDVSHRKAPERVLVAAFFMVNAWLVTLSVLTSNDVATTFVVAVIAMLGWLVFRPVYESDAVCGATAFSVVAWCYTPAILPFVVVSLGLLVASAVGAHMMKTTLPAIPFVMIPTTLCAVMFIP